MSKVIFIPAHKVLSSLSFKDDDGEYLSIFAHENAKAYCRDNEVDEDCYDNLFEAIESTASASVFEKQLDTAADFIEQTINHVNKKAIENVKVVSKGRRAGIRVMVGQSFLSVYRQAVEGYGFPTETRKMSDVTAGSVLTAARMIPEVYGTQSWDRFKDSAFDRWEPRVPSHRELSKKVDRRHRGRYR